MERALFYRRLDLDRFAVRASAAPIDGKKVFEKELIYVGDFETEDGEKFSIDEARLNHWKSTIAAFSTKGIEIPLPIEHTRDPEARRGEIVGAEIKPDSKGRTALFGLVTFRDAAAEDLAKSSQVSIFSPPKERGFDWPITHVALTDYPVVTGMDGWKPIAASIVGAKKMTKVIAFSLASLVESLGLPVAGKDDAELEVVLRGKITEMTTQLAALAEEIKKLKDGGGEEKPGDVKPPEETPAMAASLKATAMILGDNRGMKIDKFVGTKLTPAAAKVAKEKFCGEKVLALSVRGTDDGFDTFLAMLAANDDVLKLGEKSGPQNRQPISLSKDRKPGDNPMLDEADRLVEQRKASGQPVYQ